MQTNTIEASYQFMTTEEVAKLLRITARTVRSYIKDKINPLPAVRITSNTYRIKKEELIEWLNSQPDPRQDV